jgi:ribonuclease P protein component
VVSHAYPRDARLCRPSEYKKVFARGQRHSDSCFTVLTLGNELGRARLGLVVPRKAARRSVDRSRLRRIVREHFRQSRDTLPPLDIVVMARGAALQRDNSALRDSLARHWRRLPSP